MRNIKPNTAEAIKRELELLDLYVIDVKGNLLKPSQCYHVEMDPPHVLFNTNCPSALKADVINIIKKYYPEYESSTSEHE